MCVDHSNDLYMCEARQGEAGRALLQGVARVGARQPVWGGLLFCNIVKAVTRIFKF